MTFLELVKRLAAETGTELESKIESVAIPPATAYGETTEHRSRLVRWTKQAWIDVQEDQEQWDFMVHRWQIPLVEGQWIYDIKTINDDTLPPAYADKKYDEIIPFVAPRDMRYVWIVDNTADPKQRHICYYVPPEQFFGHVDRFNDRERGVPSRYSFERDGCIVFNVSPSSNDYSLEYEYRMEPHELVEDADEPRDLPKKFHEVILYKAMVFHSMFDEAGGQMQRAAKLYRDKMNKLRLEKLREYSMPGTNT